MGKQDYKVGKGKPPEHGKIKKGEVRNPNGRPRGARSLTTILQEILDNARGEIDGKKVDGNTLLMATLYKKAIDKKDLQAIREILDRLEGKPLQKTENTNKNIEVRKTIVDKRDD